MEINDIRQALGIAGVEKIEEAFRVDSLSDISLSYSKTFEEEMEEARKVSLAEIYLEKLGVKVRTDIYGYYRPTYYILKDLGEYLSKKDV